MTIREAFKSYIDADGWVMDSPWGASSNRVLDTAEYFVQLYLAGELEDRDALEFDRLTKLVEIPGYPGVINRAPGNSSQQGSDDYTGWLAAALIFGNDFAHRCLRHGQQHLWYFNNERPGTILKADGKLNTSAVFARYQAFVGHAYVCAKKLPPWLSRRAWAYSVGNTGRHNPSDQDAHTLSWLLCIAYEISGLHDEGMDEAKREFLARLYKNWPGGIRQVQKHYRADKRHPFGEVWIDCAIVRGRP